MGTDFQFCRMKSILGMDGDYGYTTMSIYPMPLNCTLKNYKLCYMYFIQNTHTHTRVLKSASTVLQLGDISLFKEEKTNIKEILLDNKTIFSSVTEDAASAVGTWLMCLPIPPDSDHTVACLSLHPQTLFRAHSPRCPIHSLSPHPQWPGGGAGPSVSSWAPNCPSLISEPCQIVLLLKPPQYPT